MQIHHRKLGDEQQNNRRESEGEMQYEVNRKEINNLRLERSAQKNNVSQKSERSGQKAINQKTELLKQESNNILKIQDDESTYLEKIKSSEKNIEMHEGNHDIKNSDGRRYNNDLITVKGCQIRNTLIPRRDRVTCSVYL